MCKQTDLTLLVRDDTQRFLRESDLRAGGRDDQFVALDEKTGTIAPAPRGSLRWGGVVPALESSSVVKLAGGGRMRVRPVFARLRDHLKAYSPEDASASCGTHPDVIRGLARDCAKATTAILLGFNSCKYYHCDVMERSMLSSSP